MPDTTLLAGAMHKRWRRWALDRHGGAADAGRGEGTARRPPAIRVRRRAHCVAARPDTGKPPPESERGARHMGRKKASGIDGFIVEHWGVMSLRQMAVALRCGHSTVKRHADALGLKQDGGGTAQSGGEAQAEASDKRAQLEALRDLLWKTINSTDSPGVVAPLSREYRETIKALDRMEAARDAAEIDSESYEMLMDWPDLSALAAADPDEETGGGE